MRIKTFHIDTYGSTIHFCYGKEDAFLKFIKAKYNIILQGGRVGHQVGFSDNRQYLWVEKFPKTAAQISYLGHEAFHVAYSILVDAGIKLSADSEECLAYLLDEILLKCLKK